MCHLQLKKRRFIRLSSKFYYKSGQWSADFITVFRVHKPSSCPTDYTFCFSYRFLDNLLDHLSLKSYFWVKQETYPFKVYGLYRPLFFNLQSTERAVLRVPLMFFLSALTFFLLEFLRNNAYTQTLSDLIWAIKSWFIATNKEYILGVCLTMVPISRGN